MVLRTIPLPFINRVMRRTILSIIIISLLSFINTFAIPAKPGLIEFVQPDGSIVYVRLYGDEKSHYYLSADNYPLIAKGDTLFFAKTDNNGQIVASQFIALNEEIRSASCKSFLNSMDRDTNIECIKQQCEKVRVRTNRRLESTDIGLFPDASFPTEGEIKALVLLVAFQDIKFNTDYDPHDYFWRMLNQPGFSDIGGYGSAYDYFRDNSSGVFSPKFDVIGPITLSRPEAFYGMNGLEIIDRNAGLMVIDACNIIDSEIDFSQYDCDNDGNIDNVFVFYAGKGEASGGDPMTIWPHSSDVKYFTEDKVILDGKTLGRYACSNEMMNNQPDGIGTFVHEFSHVLGLPDLYATSYTDAFTPGSWDVMDYGSYNNNSRTPPLLSSFERHALGWGEPAQPISGRLQIPSLIDNSIGLTYEVNDSERYYLETRIQKGWDKYIPGEGLLIWHVNYSPSVWSKNIINNTPEKQYVDIIEADKKLGENTRSGDCFPGTSGIRSIDSDSHPDLRTWDDSTGPFAISNITFDGSSISAIFKTDNFDIKLDSPILNPYFQVTSDSFTIGWSEVEDAECYEVDVKQIVKNQLYEEDINFNSGATGLPEEWDIKLGFTSSDVLNPEDSSPMLMFLQNGGFITSPEFKSNICKIDFSIMASGRKERYPFVEIYIPKDDTWELLEHTTLSVTESIVHFSYQFQENTINRFRLRFGGEQGVKIYFDNLNIYYPVESLEIPLDGFPILDYRMTAINVTNLLPSTEYIISVKALGSGIHSEASTTRIITSENTSVDNNPPPQDFTILRYHDGVVVKSEIETEAILFGIDGRIIQKISLICGLNTIKLQQHGIFFLRISNQTFRFFH